MSNNILSEEWISLVLTDLWSIHLAMISCLVSVFTLLYSFIISKKDELKWLTDQSNKGESSPTFFQRKQFAISYIKRMSKASNRCIVLLCCCSCISFMSWISIRVLSVNQQKIWIYIVCGLTLLLLFFIIHLGWKVFVQYCKDKKI